MYYDTRMYVILERHLELVKCWICLAKSQFFSKIPCLIRAETSTESSSAETRFFEAFSNLFLSPLGLSQPEKARRVEGKRQARRAAWRRCTVAGEVGGEVPGERLKRGAAAATPEPDSGREQPALLSAVRSAGERGEKKSTPKRNPRTLHTQTNHHRTSNKGRRGAN